MISIQAPTETNLVRGFFILNLMEGSLVLPFKRWEASLPTSLQHPSQALLPLECMIFSRRVPSLLTASNHLQLTNHASTYSWSRRAHSNQLAAEHLYLRVQKTFPSYRFQSGNPPPLSSQICFSPGFSTSKTGTANHPDVHISVHIRNLGVIHSTLVCLPWATSIQSSSPDSPSVK